jgi:chitodextrinase
VSGLVASASSSRITLSWNRVDDATQYRVVEHRGAATTTHTVTEPSTTFGGYAPRTLVSFDVVALDADRASGVMSVSTTTSRDTRRPTPPGSLKALARGRGKLLVRFNPARDDDRVVRYELRLLAPRMRTKLVRLPASRRSVTVSRLRPRTMYRVQVRAIDRSGNRSGWRTIRARTR